MRLPTNWPQLSATEQTFVAIDLERVNRGLTPIVGLDASSTTFEILSVSASTERSCPFVFKW